MEITAFLERENRQTTVALAAKATVKDLLGKLQINPETVLVVRKGSVILPAVSLQDKDTVKLLSVISGG